MSKHQGDEPIPAMKAVRAAVLVIIVGLVVSGLTAFPLETELTWLANRLAVDGNLEAANYEGATHWVMKVREGLAETNRTYPFIAYGTDWLAFAHIVIAFFFIPVYLDPVRYRGNLWAGFAACVLVIPMALVCGHLRGIPLGWQIFDTLFGVVCLLPMSWLLWATRHRPAVDSPSTS